MPTPRVYKLLFMDVGLMNAACGLGWTAMESLNAIKLVNEGAMAEQFIGQHLQDLLSGSPNRELTYWLREGRSSNAEVDYVAAFDGRIVPIEVKAGASGGLRSLHQFVARKGIPLAVRFDAAPPSVQTVRTDVQREWPPDGGGLSPALAAALTWWNGYRPSCARCREARRDSAQSSLVGRGNACPRPSPRRCAPRTDAPRVSLPPANRPKTSQALRATGRTRRGRSPIQGASEPRRR